MAQESENRFEQLVETLMASERRYEELLEQRGVRVPPFVTLAGECRYGWPLGDGRWMVVAGRMLSTAGGRAYVVRDVAEGWCQCFWCWQGDWNMQIPDPVARPLCLQCLDRFINGDGPPWRPNNVQRCEEWLSRMVEPTLPVVECMIPALARFLADPFVP